MKWFKFYGQDYISDPKMLSLSGSERSCWITILAYSSVDDNGMITFLSEEQLMQQAGLDPISEEWDNTKGILEKLVKLEMIQFDNGVITVINWKKRQETSLTSYERVKRYREKKRNDNAKITPEENRIDKNRKEENKEKGICFRLKTWNENQASPIQDFMPENIIGKYGVAAVERLIDKYGKEDNGFSLFLKGLKNG